VITLRVSTRDTVRIPYEGATPTNPEVALIPVDEFGVYPDDPADWRPADYTDGDITFLIGVDPHTYPVGTYAVLVRYVLGLARPEEWAGWIRLL
jgi:hypothetical protein